MGTSPTHRIAAVTFVGVVTCFLLTLLLAAAPMLSGLELGVYALAAAFGLEFLTSSWPSLWNGGPPGRERPDP